MLIVGNISDSYSDCRYYELYAASSSRTGYYEFYTASSSRTGLKGNKPEGIKDHEEQHARKRLET
jgi:predicted nucleic-acid-binding Zn-ribbon protein